MERGPYEEMKLKNWFFDTCETREQAEHELRHGREGDFIVRPSESGRGSPGALSISGKRFITFKRVRILMEDIERNCSLDFELRFGPKFYPKFCIE